MANIIKIKNKTTSGAPTALQMATKELVFNEVDNKLYYKKESDDSVIHINQNSGGTVTSIGISIGVSGSDINISGSPITTSGSITLNIPTASATNRGVISSTDWSIFNSKIGGSGTSTQVGYFSGTNTLTSSAGFTYASSILTTPYLRITNPSGTPTSIIGRNGSGDVGSITVGSGLSLSSGTLSATGGGITGSGTSGRVTFWDGSSSLSSNANFLFDNATKRMTIGKTGTGNAWLNLEGMGGAGSQKAIEIQNSGGWVNAYIKSYNTTTSASRGLIFGSVNSAGTDVDALWVQGYNANGRVGVGGVPTNIFEVFTAGENSTGSKSGIQLTSPSYKMHQFLNHEGDALFQSTTGYFSFGSTSTFPGDMNPSAPLHLFTSLGAGEDIVFKLERAGGYGYTAFYQYYITGAGGRGMKINSEIGSEPAFITTKSDHSGNNRRIGIKEESPAQTLDVGGTMRLQSVTGTPTTIIGRNASGDIGTVSIGSGLSLSGGTLSASGGSGTVTSVGLNTGTFGTDISVSGSPITTSGTFTLNIPTASASNRGALSSDDWTTFNSKISGTGSTGRVPFFDSVSTITSNSNFTYQGGTGTLTAPYIKATSSGGTATTVTGRDSNNIISDITIGSQLALSSGTLNTTGFSGTFKTGDAKIVTVVNGIITSVI